VGRVASSHVENRFDALHTNGLTEFVGREQEASSAEPIAQADRRHSDMSEFVLVTSRVLSASCQNLRARWVRVRCLLKIRLSCSSCEFREAVIMADSQQIAFVGIRSRVLGIRSTSMIRIFFAVDWSHMGWIFIQIRPPNSKFLAVRVNPFPQAFA